MVIQIKCLSTGEAGVGGGGQAILITCQEIFIKMKVKKKDKIMKKQYQKRVKKKSLRKLMVKKN